jgi:hypothetical protein
MGTRIQTSLDLIAGFDNSLDNKAFGGAGVLSELIDTLEHPQTGEYVLAAGELDTAVDMGDITEARLVYLEGDSEFEVVFNGTAATGGIITGAAGTFPTLFAGGETLLFSIDATPITVTFDALDQTLTDVVARINHAAALMGFLSNPVAFAVGGEVQLRSPTVGGSSVVDVTGGTGAATLGVAVSTSTGVAAGGIGTNAIAVERPADPAGASAAAGLKAYLLATVKTTSVRLSNPGANSVRIKVFMAGDLIIAP